MQNCTNYRMRGQDAVDGLISICSFVSCKDTYAILGSFRDPRQPKCGLTCSSGELDSNLKNAAKNQ